MQSCLNVFNWMYSLMLLTNLNCLFQFCKSVVGMFCKETFPFHFEIVSHKLYLDMWQVFLWYIGQFDATFQNPCLDLVFLSPLGLRLNAHLCPSLTTITTYVCLNTSSIDIGTPHTITPKLLTTHYNPILNLLICWFEYFMQCRLKIWHVMIGLFVHEQVMKVSISNLPVFMGK